jgi:hypothetical protein
MISMRNRCKQLNVPVHLDEEKLNDNLGKGNYIFVGSSCDMFARDVPVEWELKVLDHAKLYENKYLFQTKNVMRVTSVLGKLNFPVNSILCSTLETNREYDLYNDCPTPCMRASYLRNWTGEKMITIEPILDFDLLPFLELIKQCEPSQVNIGAKTGGNGLLKPIEPEREKLIELISELEKFTVVHQKSNLKRLLKEEEQNGKKKNDQLYS